MIESRLGECAALVTAFCWTTTAMAFESASKKVGSLQVNLIRLLLGGLFLTIFCWISRGLAFPVDAPPRAWLWLSLSGLAGFAIGDLFLFRAYVVIGSRIATLVQSLVPPFTAILAWIVLGETLSSRNLAGMALTTGGVALVALERKTVENNKTRLKHPVSGMLCALGGVLGQSVGLVLSKLGMGNYNAFASTQIRILTGIAGFTLLFFILNRWHRLAPAIRDRGAMARITLGSFFGPFLGVSFSLLAVQHTSAGIASTIMAIIPVLIIPPAVLIFKERVTFREAVGAFIAVAGVTLMFL